MNLVADESVDSNIVARLRAEGHEVFYIAERSPSISDDEVLEIANTHSALLLTADKDFGELIFRLDRMHSGIMLLRLAGLADDDKISRVLETIQRHAVELAGAFTVVSASSIRIRPKI